MFFEPQNQRNKAKKGKKRRSDILFQILSLNPTLLLTTISCFSLISHDFKDYKCVISKSIKFVESEKIF